MSKMDISALYSIYKNFPTICTDTRKIVKDSLFFALKGDNFNGNEFAAKSLASGSKYAIVDEEKYCISDQYILVDDVLSALQNLARYHRKQLTIPVIAITGSNGKTTTKELIHAVLSQRYKTLATIGNLNNHIGVPLTLLSITDKHEMAVVEMGANHLKEIELLCSIAEPDYGIITNIGKAHIEGFGSIENIAIGKSEMFQFIKQKKGKLFVNGDNKKLLQLSEGIDRITYGSAENNSFIASFESATPFVHFKLLYFPDAISVHTQIIGAYNFDNCAAAAAIGNYFEIDTQSIVNALENYVPGNNRSQVIERGNNTLLLDAYNANPSSMEAAIRNFAALQVKSKMVILGDMLELGDESDKEHQQIISLLQDCKIDKVYLVGPLFKKVRNTIGAIQFNDSREAYTYFKENQVSNCSLLIKGSRGIKLEGIVEAFS